ncbi:conserved hypothetical protein [Streptomyces sviceus ATCC 29083]|uniref:Uncharacterized protein n=1 Tax=Streptomyces sviceus (strain ATCC 29083 / DSM 924 / JCM 4929 / NBRC 13980 / NCIMB 11184 / NRRL 5439 / UC 5370) TaxID=463191 RepID=B5HUW5_STRX2|nr:conserved hypothetical protein [Streptomyces sviceus ATCC 29083]
MCGLPRRASAVAAEVSVPSSCGRTALAPRGGLPRVDGPARNDKRQFRQILGRLTRVITGTLDPHLARYPDDEWAQLATAQLTGVRATLAQLSKQHSSRRSPLPSPPCPLLPVAAATTSTRPTTTLSTSSNRRLESVAFGQGVGVGEEPARDGTGRRRAGADRLRLAAKIPADVVTAGRPVRADDR